VHPFVGDDFFEIDIAIGIEIDFFSFSISTAILNPVLAYPISRPVDHPTRERTGMQCGKIGFFL
jgi:hypothetical protein